MRSSPVRLPGLRIVGLLLGLLLSLLVAGCVKAPPSEPPVIGATQGGAVQPVTPAAPRRTGPSIAKSDPPAAKPPVPVKAPEKVAVKVPASPAATEQPPKKESAAPVPPVKQPASPPLDLVSLEQRLRDTKAIGLFTKISLKNQVDDLLTQFRTFHEGRAGAVLTELRERYNLLLLKVLSLLQGSDPMLAQDIAGSREAIWGVLADPVKFARL